MINALKWLVKFLETRFPEKVDPANYVLRAEFKAVTDVCTEILQRQEKDIESFKKQIEVLNLRVGLSRPMQTVLRNKSNG